MDQVSDIGNGHQGNASPIKSTSSLGCTGLSLLLTGFVLALALFLMIVLTARLSEEFVNFARGHFHGDKEIDRTGRGCLRIGVKIKVSVEDE